MLKEGQTDKLDIDHLVEELEDMSKSNFRELENCLLILIAHLLKWQFQPKRQSGSWRGSIIEQRVRLTRLLKQMPSLQVQLGNAVIDVYSDSIILASKETKLSKSIFPYDCPYSLTQLLDDDFYPKP